MLEFEINGESYRAQKIAAMTQNDLVRKLAPVLPNLVPLFAAFFKLKDELVPDEQEPDSADGEAKVKSTAESDLLDKIAGLAPSISPLADALASMSKENSDFIIYTCLASVSFKKGNNWASLCRGDTIMFDELELATIYQIVIKVLRENLGNFITGLVTTAKAAASPAA